MKLMEAVPNFSEGRRTDVINAIVRRVADVSRAKVLNVDSNADANRTVLTLAGEAQEVRKSALELFKATRELLDMRTHHGAHPRLGAVDVCPFVPIADMTLAEAAAEARQLGQQVAKLNIPVYFYEKNAPTPERQNLAFLRRGEYESLPKKLQELPPDLGPQTYTESVAKTGASVIGARNFLLAYNISLNTTDITPARKIAALLREKNGGLKAVKAIGWLMPGYQAAQVSFNLTDFYKTGMAEVFEACRQEAGKLGLSVTGSELIGLAPLEALLRAGRFYKQQSFCHNSTYLPGEISSGRAVGFTLQSANTVVIFCLSYPANDQELNKVLRLCKKAAVTNLLKDGHFSLGTGLLFKRINASTILSTFGGGLKQPRPALQIGLICARNWLKTDKGP